MYKRFRLQIVYYSMTELLFEIAYRNMDIDYSNARTNIVWNIIVCIFN